MENLVLFGSFGSAMADAATDPTNHPLGAAGLLAMLYAGLRILYAQFGDKLPEWIAAILSKIPGFPAALTPVVQMSLVEILKLLMAHLVAQGVPAAEAATIVQEVAKSTAPPILAATAANFDVQIAAALAAKPGT